MSDQTYTGIYRAVVHDTGDPASKNRVRLLVPAILGKTPTGWADPVSGRAGAGQVVWAMFEGGDLNRPVYFPAPTAVAADDGQTYESREVGEIVMWPTNIIPDGWALCDGTVLDRVTYAELFAVIGTLFNTGGETSSQFRLPDLKGRVLVGRNTAISGFENVGARGGEKDVTLTIGQIPAHNHAWSGVNDGAASSGSPGSYPFRIYQDRLANWPGTQANMSTAGGGGAHNNMQPYLIGNYIIRVQKRVPTIVVPPVSITLSNMARVATTGNITLSGLQPVDGVALASGDVVLVWRQTTASQNGVYVVSTGTWVRHPNFDTGSKLAAQNVRVMEGTMWAGWEFKPEFGSLVTIGTSPLPYRRAHAGKLVAQRWFNGGPAAHPGNSGAQVGVLNDWNPFGAGVGTPTDACLYRVQASVNGRSGANAAGFWYLYKKIGTGTWDIVEQVRFHNNADPYMNWPFTMHYSDNIAVPGEIHQFAINGSGDAAGNSVVAGYLSVHVEYIGGK